MDGNLRSIRVLPNAFAYAYVQSGCDLPMGEMSSQMNALTLCSWSTGIVRLSRLTIRLYSWFQIPHFVPCCGGGLE